MPIVLPPELGDNDLILQVRAQWDVSFTGRGESSWSFHMDRTVDIVGQTNGLAALWMDNIKPFWMARRPPEWHFTRLLVEDRWPHETIGAEITVDEYGEDGPYSGAPVQLSPIFTLYTAYSGRSYRGRTFWGQIRVQDLDGSNLSDGMWSAMTAWEDAMHDVFIAPSMFPSDPKLCIVSRQHDLVPEPKGRWAPVTAIAQKRYLALQRRRNRYYQS